MCVRGVLTIDLMGDQSNLDATFTLPLSRPKPSICISDSTAFDLDYVDQCFSPQLPRFHRLSCRACLSDRFSGKDWSAANGARVNCHVTVTRNINPPLLSRLQTFPFFSFSYTLFGLALHIQSLTRYNGFPKQHRKHPARRGFLRQAASRLRIVSE